MSSQPDPDVWPECETHGVAWVLRRCITFTGSKWLWQSDCPKKCRANPVLVNANGRVGQTDTGS